MSHSHDGHSEQIPVTGHEDIDQALASVAEADSDDLDAQAHALNQLQGTLDAALAQQPE